jgi:hypothetical protein
VKRPAPDVPRLLLGVTSLALPVRATRDRQLEVSGRFRESEALAVALVKGVAAGAEAVLAPPTPAIRAALDELPKELPILVRVPHLLPADDLRYEPALLFDPGDEDDPAAPGSKHPGAAAKDLLPVGLGGSLAGRVLPRIEREAALFTPASLRGIVVSAAATDLAVAGNQPRFFERIMKFARPRHWMTGFETRNLGHLLARLTSWGVKPDFVIGPLNPRGVGMMPDRDTVLTAIEQGGMRVIANELRAGGMVALEEGAAWARQHGAWGVCAELVDMDDVPRELKGLAPQAAV